MEAFIEELQTVVTGLRAQSDTMAQEDRRDEADLLKIRANIYEVCATIAGVVCRTQPEENRRAVYLQKLDALPRNWHVARQAALDHGNTLRAAVEDVKLEALNDVLSRFQAKQEG